MNSHSETVENSTNDNEFINDCDRTLLCDSNGSTRPESTSESDLDTAYSAGQPVFASWLDKFRQFVVNKTNLWFFVGSVCLIVGAALYINAVGTDDSEVFNLSLILIFAGGFFVWVPIFYWMSDPANSEETTSDQETPYHQSSIPSPPVHIPRDKPPDYETLTPLESPPPYDEINLFGDYPHPQTLMPNSTAVDIEVPAVHQLAVGQRGNSREIRVEPSRLNGRGIARRRSTGDLYCTDKEQDHVQI